MICPFCSLLCDVEQPPSCALYEMGLQWLTRARSQQERSPTGSKEGVPIGLAFVGGKQTTLEVAIRRTAELVGSTAVSLLGHFVCVDSVQSAFKLARRCDADIDAANSDPALDFYRAIQHQGLTSTSISEARTRSDLILFIGDDRLFEAHPLLLEQLLLAEKRVTDQPCRAILLGDFSPKTIEQFHKQNMDWLVVRTDLEHLPESLFGLLDQRWQRGLQPYQGPVRWIMESEFLVVLWNPSLIEAQHRQHWNECLLHWIQDWNRGATCAALPIHSLNGVFAKVCLWSTGYPGRISFQSGEAIWNRHPYRESTSPVPPERTVLWVDERWNSRDRAPVSARIVLSSQWEDSQVQASDVLIPITIPGVQADAVMLHADGVQLHRCRALNQDSGLPTVATVLSSIHKQLELLQGNRSHEHDRRGERVDCEERIGYDGEPVSRDVTSTET